MLPASRVILAATLVLGLPTASATDSPNIVVNPSFEQGEFSPAEQDSWVNVFAGETKITGWTIGGQNVNWHNPVHFQPMVDGLLAIDLDHGGVCYGLGTGTLSQVLPTVPGETYELRVAVTGPIDLADGCSGTDPRRLAVTVDGATTHFAVPASPNRALQWTDQVLIFTAATVATTVTLASGEQNGGYWGPVIDNVRVVSLGALDGDADGVPDRRDRCGTTPAGSVVNADGCSVPDLCPCAGPAAGGAWRNHGRYVSCTALAARNFVQAGRITSRQASALVSAAARASCGKP
ncbi:MAG: DUF642 domain-containing protein [Acidobacteriota bacterium]